MGIKSTKGKNKFEQIDYKATSDIGETLDPVFSADATGGTILYHSADDGTSVEKYHVFTEPGYFRVSAGFAKTANVLMIAGGGGGGTWYYGGGGGAGEVLYGSNVGFGTSISNYDRDAGSEYRVIIGEGGFSHMSGQSPGEYNNGGNGGDTILHPTAGIATAYRSHVGFVTEGMRAFGGGGGGSNSADGYEEGNRGGSAGGPSYYDEHERYKQRISSDLPDAWTSYGNPSGPNSNSVASGGGGAGGNSPSRTGGAGQPFPEFTAAKIGPAIPPYVYPFWNTTVGSTGLYGGGGCGAGYPATNPNGGTGGGGDGGNGNGGGKHGEPGVDFTGSGGGGGDGPLNNGGSGGKGILIIKYVV